MPSNEDLKINPDTLSEEQKVAIAFNQFEHGIRLIRESIGIATGLYDWKSETRPYLKALQNLESAGYDMFLKEEEQD